MRTFAAVLLAAAGLLGGCAKPVAPAPPPMPQLVPVALHSPWDMTPLAVTKAPYDCGPPAPVSTDIEMGSLDERGEHLNDDVKQAAYSRSVTALRDATERVSEAANAFRRTGSHDAAACVVMLLDGMASSRAMTGYMADASAMRAQSIALRAFAVAYLKVRPARTASAQQEQTILNWMNELVREERTYWAAAPCSANACLSMGRMGNETALASMEVGIASGDQSLVRYAVERYKAQVVMIDERGMLPNDTQSEYALLRNLLSAASLVQIAELASVNQIDLYDFDGGRLRLLVHTVGTGLVTPSIYSSAAHVRQVVPGTIEPWEVRWAAAYDQHFPDPIMTGLLRQANSSGADMWSHEPMGT